MTTNQTFNFADEKPEIDRLIRMVKVADARNYVAVNKLADLARKDWLCNNSLETAEILYTTLKGLKNKALYMAFCRNFNAFCGVYQYISDKKGGMKMAYDAANNVFKISDKGITTVDKDYGSLREKAKHNTETLLKMKYKFCDLSPITPPVEDKAKLAKQRYDSIISALKTLRDTHDDWKNSDNEKPILELLEAASAVLPSLNVAWLEKVKSALENAANQ